MDNPIRRYPLLLDGATGTNLMARDRMPLDGKTQLWVLEHFDRVAELQKEFIASGSSVIYAPTLQANRFALKRSGIDCSAAELNEKLVALSCDAAENRAMVAVSVGPTGEVTEPFGETTFQEIVDAYREQVQTAKNSGAQLIAIETMTSLTDARAAVLASTETGLPVFVTVVVDEEGKMPSSKTDLLCALTVLQSMGIDGFGLNCCGSPKEIRPFLDQIQPYSDVPLMAKPNPGHPNPARVGLYDLGPQEFAKQMVELVQSGVSILGGCCGTTPEHILVLSKALAEVQIIRKETRSLEQLLLSNERDVYYMSEELNFGEPISCGFDMADEILRYEESGFNLIPIQIDSQEDVHHMSFNQHMFGLPVIFSSHDSDLLQEALFCYQGRAMIDRQCSIEGAELERLAKRYGAVIY